MLKVERGIVRQIVDDVKTNESRKELSIDTAMLTVLRGWKQTTAFAADTDWIFASPAQRGRLPVVLSANLEGVSGRGEGSAIGKLAHSHNAPHLPQLA